MGETRAVRVLAGHGAGLLHAARHRGAADRHVRRGRGGLGHQGVQEDLLGLDVRGQPRPPRDRAPDLRHLAHRAAKPPGRRSSKLRRPRTPIRRRHRPATALPRHRRRRPSNRRRSRGRSASCAPLLRRWSRRSRSPSDVNRPSASSSGPIPVGLRRPRPGRQRQSLIRGENGKGVLARQRLLRPGPGLGPAGDGPGEAAAVGGARDLQGAEAREMRRDELGCRAAGSRCFEGAAARCSRQILDASRLVWNMLSPKKAAPSATP